MSITCYVRLGNAVLQNHSYQTTDFHGFFIRLCSDFAIRDRNQPNGRWTSLVARFDPFNHQQKRWDAKWSTLAAIAETSIFGSKTFLLLFAIATALFAIVWVPGTVGRFPN